MTGLNGADAASLVKEPAKIVTKCCGGEGVIREIADKIIEQNKF